ncbi:glutamate-cysteine ligase family protein [Paenibacillus sp. FSL L8-0689]|uniref:glutamate-cysteine ligase family protein n=1 Tax=Paenibacillus sp. FSL L8-0689 TaxID=2921607 RepID=UPI0030FA0C10
MSKTVSLNPTALMNRAFLRQLRQLEKNILVTKNNLSGIMGFETEYLLFDFEFNLVDEKVRNRVIENATFIKREIGASQIELVSRPFTLAEGLENLINEMQQMEQEAAAIAHAQNNRLARLGTYPGSFTDLEITDDRENYQMILDQFKSSRKHHLELHLGEVDLSSRVHELISGCQSTQMNVQVNYNQAAIDLLNKTIEISPLFIAIGANSPILDRRLTGLLETRNLIWEIGYDLRTYSEFLAALSTRVSFPHQYYANFHNYWATLYQQKHMKSDPRYAFSLNQKMNWKIARLKLVGGSGKPTACLLETRFIPIQPTLREDIALHLGVYALLDLSLSKGGERLLPVTFVKENFRRASCYGIDCELYYFTSDGKRITEYAATELINRAGERICDYWKRKSSSTATLVEEVLSKRLRVGPPALSLINNIRGNSKNTLLGTQEIKRIVSQNCIPVNEGS